MLEPRRYNRLPAGLVIDSNTVTIDAERQKSGKVPVLVRNQTDKPLWLYSNDVVGEVFLCNVEGPIQTSQQHVDTCDANRTGGLGIEGLDFSESPASSEDVDKVRNVLRNYPHAFSQSDTDLGRSNIVTHNIPLTDHQPFRERYRRIPQPCMQRCVNMYVQCMRLV